MRIRIPPLNYVCIVESCRNRTSSLLCTACIARLHARMRQEVPPATLPREAEVRHRTSLSSNLSC